MVRAAVPGLELPSLSTFSKEFDHWWENGGRNEWQAKKPFGAYRRRKPAVDRQQAEARWKREAKNLWLAKNNGADPLAQRLIRLRSLGYVDFHKDAGSLDVGRRVRKWAVSRTSK
jgi:hypothetical protein